MAPLRSPRAGVLSLRRCRCSASGRIHSRPICTLFELHEHEIPNLDETVFPAEGRSTICSKIRSEIPENLGRMARTVLYLPFARSCLRQAAEYDLPQADYLAVRSERLRRRSRLTRHP